MYIGSKMLIYLQHEQDLELKAHDVTLKMVDTTLN